MKQNYILSCQNLYDAIQYHWLKWLWFARKFACYLPHQCLNTFLFTSNCNPVLQFPFLFFFFFFCAFCFIVFSMICFRFVFILYFVCGFVMQITCLIKYFYELSMSCVGSTFTLLRPKVSGWSYWVHTALLDVHIW